MKSYLAFPPYTVSFLLLTIIQKLYLIVYNTSARGFDLSLAAALPVSFPQDAAVALALFFLLDLPAMVLRGAGKGRIAAVWEAAGGGLYFFIVLYSFIVLKFYSLFGTYLTFGLAMQAHGIGNYRAGIMNEVDLHLGVLIAAAVAYFLLTVIARGRISRHLGRGDVLPKESYARRGAMIRLPVKGILYAAVIFILYMAASSTILERVNKSANLYSLDYNPLYELAQSTYDAEFRGRGEKPAPAGGRKPYSSDSVVNRESLVRGIDLKTGTRERMKEMNVVFYLLESTSAIYLEDTAGFSDSTPNIRSLARRSMTLENHYCQEPASIKSLYSVLTGRLPYKTRDWEDFLARSRKDTTIADILKERGYDTAFFTTQDGRIYYLNSYLKGRFNTVVDKEAVKKRGWNYRDFSVSLDDRVLVRLFDEYLAGRKGKFFAFISAMFPHHPYITPSPEFARNGGGTLMDRYKNSLAFADHVIGEVYRVLQKYDRVNDTIFVLFSDHGEAFYQHPGNFLHSIYLYEENVKTLCMISSPLLIREGGYHHVTRHIDIVPTVLDLMGIGGDPYPLDGASLLRPRRYKFAPFYTAFSKDFLGLRDGNWKYIVNRRYNSEELYDLSRDPGEKMNVAPENRELCRDFQGRLTELDDYVK